MLQYWADKWTAALRSGEYGQANGYLKVPVATNGCGVEGCCPPRTAGFCCLGVLTDVVIKEMPGVGVWNEAGRFVATGDDYGTGDFLPKVIREITGISANDPVLIPSKDEYNNPVTASSANDELKKSFEEIAALIEGRVAEL